MNNSNNPSKENKILRYATANDATIEAVIHEMFRFTSIEQAKARLKAINETFITSKHQFDSVPEAKENTLILWIKGYSVTEEEDEQGFYGHYAMVAIKEIKGGKYTLHATKLESELKRHPQRKLVKQKHPNWGHPVLRKLKAGKELFTKIEEAQKLLERLHEDFPEVSIPTPTKLHLMIYSAASKPAVKKHVLEIKASPSGGFIIECRESEIKKKLDKKKSVNQSKPRIKLNKEEKAIPSINEESSSEDIIEAFAQGDEGIVVEQHDESQDDSSSNSSEVRDEKGFFASREELRRQKKRR